jgi:hypothetical protein
MFVVQILLLGFVFAGSVIANNRNRTQASTKRQRSLFCGLPKVIVSFSKCYENDLAKLVYTLVIVDSLFIFLDAFVVLFRA